MLREQVLTEWNHLCSLITTDQQYHWGQLLRRLDIVSLAPDLTFEIIVQEIRVSIERKENLSFQLCTLKNNIRPLKNFVNTPKAITPYNHQVSKAKNIRQELKQEQEYNNFLKNQINEIYLSDDDDGPTIDEVE